MTTKLQRFELANLFYQELYDATESFENLPPTMLANFLYLNGAILGDDVLSLQDCDAKLLVDFLSTLPTSNVWLPYVTVFY